MLTPNELIQLKQALSIWAKSTPDVPVFGFLQGEKLLSPSEIVQAVMNETEDGRAILAVLEHGVRREGLISVTARIGFRRPEPRMR